MRVDIEKQWTSARVGLVDSEMGRADSPPWETVTSKKRKSSITSPRPSLPSTPRASFVGSQQDEDGFTKVITKEQRRKLKKVAKKENLEAHQQPHFQFDTNGFHRKIGIAHIRDFVIHIVTGQGQPPNWIVAQNRTNIAHTLVLLVPGISPQHLGLPPVPPSAMLPFATSTSQYIANNTAIPVQALPQPQLPIIPKLFSYACPTRAPGDSRRLHSVLGTLVMSAIPDAEKSRRKKEKEKTEVEAKTKSEVNADPSKYLLTPDEMVDNDYRLPSYMSATGSGTSRNHNNINLNGKGKEREDEWVETPRRVGEGDWRVLAIDCEMCLSADGQELARISCVDYETGQNVFDALVKPRKPIVDYLTQWSGITPEALVTATHTLATVQAHLLDPANNLITPNTILLGHSLECDLNALKIKHPHCIDTSVIFQHPKGPPYKQGLKFLAGRFLNREIQNAQGSKVGHDSEEDAKACVDLLKAKLAYGPEFGVVPQETESIFERLARNKNTTLVCDHGNPLTWYGAKATTVVQCESDQQVVDGLKAHVGSHELSFGRLMALQKSLGWAANKRVADDATPPAEVPASEALATLNSQLEDLYTSLPKQTAVVLLTGHADPLPMLALTSRRQRWEREVRQVGISHVTEKWTAEDERELESAVMQAREGIAFFCVR